MEFGVGNPAVEIDDRVEVVLSTGKWVVQVNSIRLNKITRRRDSRPRDDWTPGSTVHVRVPVIDVMPPEDTLHAAQANLDSSPYPILHDDTESC